MNVVRQILHFLRGLNPPTVIWGIFIGIIGKYVYDYYVRYIKAKRKDRVKWDNKGFFLTLIVSGFISFMLYSLIFDEIQSLNDPFLVFATGVQTGFFSQSIIGELGKSYTDTNS